MPFQKTTEFVKKTAYQKLLQARALFYTMESLPIHVIDSWVAGTEVGDVSEETAAAVLREIQALLARDAENFAKGIYPESLMLQRPTVGHLINLSEVYLDSFRAAFKRRKKSGKVFSAQVQKELEDYPEYYRRNFHFQTDGYLSAASARRYDLQVELLFRGMADSMRRSILKPMVQWGGLSHILEVGCGAGTATKMLAQTFPHARITAVDISPHYIQFAKKNCQQFSNIDFLVGRAEDLPFKDKRFDACVSVFLFHELPYRVRTKVIDEAQRVCKDDGFWGLVDSIQMEDVPEFDGFLKNFPVNFHEPFFKDYVTRPLRELMGTHKPFQEEVHFLSKMFCRKKIEILP